MFERPSKLRVLPPPVRERRLARWVKHSRTPHGRLLQAIGRADQRVLVALGASAHTPTGDRIAKGLGFFGEMGAGWVALAGAGALLRPERREGWATAAVVPPLAIGINYAIKLTIGRQRPILEDHPPLARAPSKLSFPSAHSTSSVAAAVALGRVAPETRPFLYPLAAAVCLGRPYLGMHYPTDVLAGMSLGYLIGRSFPLPPSEEPTTEEVEVESRVPAPPAAPATEPVAP